MLKAKEFKENKTIFNKIGLFLFCLYVFMSYVANDSLISSIFSSYSLYLFLAYSAIYILINRKIKLSSTTVWLLIFMGISLLSMIYSPEKKILGGTFYFLIVNVILVTLLAQYTINLNTVETIALTYAVSSATMILILIVTGRIQDFSNSGRLGEELFGNANILASMLMVAAMYAIWLLIYGKNNIFKKILLALCIMASYYGLFLSGGRKYIIVPVIFLYILLLFKTDKSGKKHLIKYTIIVACVAILGWVLIMNVPAFYEVIGVRMESLLSFLNGDTANADGSSKIRSQMIEMGLKQWILSPIWGYGFDSFKHYNVTVTGHFYYSHNNFVELLYNTGIIGFVAYYWQYGKIFIKAWKSKKTISPKARAFAVALIVSMLAYEYGAINYTTTSTMVMFYIIEKMFTFEKESDNRSIKL